MNTIIHIIEVTRQKGDQGPEKYSFEESELDEMLALLRGLEEKNIPFSHRWEVVGSQAVQSNE